jgi:hypothetical protein
MPILYKKKESSFINKSIIVSFLIKEKNKIKYKNKK